MNKKKLILTPKANSDIGKVHKTCNLKYKTREQKIHKHVWEFMPHYVKKARLCHVRTLYRNIYVCKLLGFNPYPANTESDYPLPPV